MTTLLSSLIPPHADLTLCAGGGVEVNFTTTPDLDDTVMLAVSSTCHLPSFPATGPLRILIATTSLSHFVATFLAICATYGAWGAGNVRVWEPIVFLAYPPDSPLDHLDALLSTAYSGGLSVTSEVFIVRTRADNRISVAVVVAEVYSLSNNATSLVVHRHGGEGGGGRSGREKVSILQMGKVGRRTDFRGIRLRASSAVCAKFTIICANLIIRM